VEYTAPEPIGAQTAAPNPGKTNVAAADSATSTNSHTATDDDQESSGGDFGEELATKLAAQDPQPPAAESSDVTPIAGTDTAVEEIVGDRNATKSSEVPSADSKSPAETPLADDIFSDPPAGEVDTNPPASTDTTTAKADIPGTEAAESPTADDSFDSIFGEQPDNEDATAKQNEDMIAEEREAKAEVSDIPLASPPDDPIPAAKNTRLATWLLGSKLSLAALANDHGAPAAEVQKLFDQSQSLAKMLGLTVPELPARPESGAPSPVTEPALDYLFTQGQEIGRELARKQSPDQAALFEVAVKSNLLLVLYQSGAPTTEAIATAIEQAGSRANLPPEVWQPLLDVLASRASQADVQKAVFKLHAEVDDYLTL
jgi:hypothetical protein